MKRGMILVGAASLLAACATTEGYRQQTATYVGTHADVLLVELGPPVARDPLSNGGEVWTYYREHEHSAGGYTRPVTRTRTITWLDDNGNAHTRTESYTDEIYEPPRYWTSECETRFVLDEQRIVRSFRFDGDACLAEEIEPVS